MVVPVQQAASRYCVHQRLEPHEKLFDPPGRWRVEKSLLARLSGILSDIIFQVSPPCGKAAFRQLAQTAESRERVLVQQGLVAPSLEGELLPPSPVHAVPTVVNGLPWQPCHNNKGIRNERLGFVQRKDFR